MSSNDGTLGVGVALIVMATGGMLVYTALHGKGAAAVFGGDVGSSLNPAGGSGDFTNGNTDFGGGDITDSTGSPSSGVGGAPGLGAPPFGGLGTTTIDGVRVANWIAAKVICARKKGWTGKVTSGQRSIAEQRQACINVCGNANGCPGTCAEPGSSNHQGIIFPEGAIDVTDPAGFANAVRGCPGPKLINALPDDRVHFSYTGH